MAATLQPYPTYNPVDYDYVQALPESWKLLPNIALFEERIERGHDEEELLSVTIKRGVIKQTEVEIKKDNSNEDKSKYKLVKPGDIAYNKMRMWQGAVGYSRYRGIASPAYVILKPKVPLNSRYFHYMLRSGFYTNYSKRFSYGIVDDQLSLRYTDFKRMYSIVPPPAIQNAVVDYLDEKCAEIDRFIRNKERLIELLEEQKKNFIDEMIFERYKISANDLKSIDDLLLHCPLTLKWKRLKYLTRIISKGTTPSTEGGNMTSEGVKFIKAENIAKEIVNSLPEFFIDEWTNKLLKRSQLKENDILMVIAGATIGRVAILNKEFLPANTNQAVSFIRFKKKVDVHFCYYWLQSNFVNTSIWLKAVQAAQPNIAMQDLGDLFIPSLNEKEKVSFVEKVTQKHHQLNNAIREAWREIAAIKEYQEALITQLITGQLSPFASN